MMILVMLKFKVTQLSDVILVFVNCVFFGLWPLTLYHTIQTFDNPKNEAF